MRPLQVKRALRDQAEARVRNAKQGAAHRRTGQVSRSTISVGDDDIPIDAVLTGSVDDSATVVELGTAVSFADDDLIDSFDTIVDAGDAADVDAMVDAYDREPDLSEEWEAIYDSDEEAHQAHMSGIGATEAVGSAEANAEKAITDASFATETALGNARYRQVDGGSVTPPMPEGGFRVGAELVRVKVGGTPYQVDVWNGTEWTRAQYLADQILVPGENGTIAIGNAEIYAPTIIGGEFYGNSFEGGLFDGGKFVLRSAKVLATLANDTFESTNPWNGTLTTAQKHSGARSILAPVSSSIRRAERTGLIMPANTETVRMSAWVYSAAAGEVAITARGADAAAGSFGAKNVAANTWTQITGFYDAAQAVQGAIIFGARGVPTSTAALYIDDVVIEALDAAGDTLTVDRDIENGEAQFRVFSELGQGISVGRRGILLDNGAGKLGTIQNNATIAGSLAITAYQSNVEIRGTEIRLQSPVVFESTAKFQGDTEWANATLPAGITGTARWRRVAGVIWVEYNLNFASLADQGFHQPLFTLPDEARPSVNQDLGAYGSGTSLAVGAMSSGNGQATVRNYRGQPVTNFSGGGRWLSK